MMKAKKIAVPTLGLSTARHVDWGEVAGDCADGYEVQLPAPTYGAWSDRDLDAPAAVDKIAARAPDRPLSRYHGNLFEESEAYGEWRDSFEPMMNYAWPVSLARGVRLETAIQAIEDHGSACVLIELSDDASDRIFGDPTQGYVIALTGGGMDLSDHIAAAYLACGCVPPAEILGRLSNVMGADQARRMPLRAAYQTAADHYANRAKRLREESRRVHAKRESR